MWEEKDYIELDEKEHNHTLEELAIVLALLDTSRTDIEKEISYFYQKYGKDGVVTYQDAKKQVSKENRKRRLAVLLLALGSILESTFTSFQTNLKAHLTQIIEIESEFFSVKISIDDVLTIPWGLDNTTWLSRLMAYQDKWNEVISNDLLIALIKNEPIEKILKQLEKRFKSMDYILKRLWESESSAIRALARKEIFKELGVDYYIFYTKEDERRCATCGELHEIIFPFSEYEVGTTAPPIHSNCRCWTVPIME